MYHDDLAHERLRTTLARWAELPDPAWEALAEIFRPRAIPERAWLLRPGDEEHELVYVDRGLLRIYYIDEEGRESNKAFPAEGGFAGPLASALLRQPSRYGIQALEKSRLLVAPYARWFKLLDQDPAFDRLGRKMLEWVLAQRELREQSLLQKSARQRYLEFIETHPELVRRVPQYHVASYLGVTEVTLSRLKGSLESKST